MPNDIDSDNEVDSKSREDPATTFNEKSIVVYFNDPDCNNSAENDSVWVFNANVNFNYSVCLDDVNTLVDMSPLQMPLPMLTMHASKR